MQRRCPVTKTKAKCFTGLEVPTEQYAHRHAHAGKSSEDQFHCERTELPPRPGLSGPSRRPPVETLRCPPESPDFSVAVFTEVWVFEQQGRRESIQCWRVARRKASAPNRPITDPLRCQAILRSQVTLSVLQNDSIHSCTLRSRLAWPRTARGRRGDSCRPGACPAQKPRFACTLACASVPKASSCPSNRRTHSSCRRRQCLSRRCLCRPAPEPQRRLFLRFDPPQSWYALQRASDRFVAGSLQKPGARAHSPWDPVSRPQAPLPRWRPEAHSMSPRAFSVVLSRPP